MKSVVLLQQLEIQLEKLALAVEPHANKRTTQARFDHQLFHCHTTRLGDYLLEVRQTLAQLAQSVRDNRTESVAWMARLGGFTNERATA